MVWAIRKQEWDPFRLFSCSGDSCENEATRELVWVLPLDVVETKDQVVVKAELPGFKAEDINVSVLGNTLTITGQRKQESEVAEGQYYRRELASGTFQRQVELPQTVNTDALKATYKNGILELTFPKREETKPKQIKIETE